jgi:hypothetical protein
LLPLLLVDFVNPLSQVHAHLGQKAEKVGIFRDGV